MPKWARGGPPPLLRHLRWPPLAHGVPQALLRPAWRPHARSGSGRAGGHGRWRAASPRPRWPRARGRTPLRPPERQAPRSSRAVAEALARPRPVPGVRPLFEARQLPSGV
eukprot:scaffold43556_cov22-Tisochrysis_lutea.AAC.2